MTTYGTAYLNTRTGKLVDVLLEESLEEATDWATRFNPAVETATSGETKIVVVKIEVVE